MTSDKDFISTQGVSKFYFLNPKAEDILITDIAHSLSLTCRFGGHSSCFYSVAEHSIIVAEILEKQGADKLTVLAGLLHDAEEAYLPDIPSPIKNAISEVQFMYLDLRAAISNKFHLDDADWKHIKDIDERLCITEAKQLGLWHEDWKDTYGGPLPFELHLWSSDDARMLFLINFVELSEDCYVTTLR